MMERLVDFLGSKASISARALVAVVVYYVHY